MEPLCGSRDGGRSQDIRDATVNGAYDRVLVDTGLIITAQSGDRLLVSLDATVPLDLLLTRDDAIIEEAIRQSARIRSHLEVH